MEYCLTAEEVLYLAAVGGADTFYGVRDTLSGLTDRELRLKVVEMENSLGAKGYLEEDFDGNRSVLKELSEVIERCGGCERFLCFERKEIGGEQKAYMYFMSGNAAYKMACGKDQYTFSAIGLPEVRREVELGLTFQETEKKEEGSFQIPYGELEKAVTLARRGSPEKGVELLKEAGASDSAAQAVMNGALHKADFYALLFMDLREEREPGYSLHCLSGDGLTVIEYGADGEDDQDHVRFLTVDEGELKERLRAGFEKIDCLVEEETFS